MILESESMADRLDTIERELRSLSTSRTRTTCEGSFTPPSAFRDQGTQAAILRLIPYYAWANRESSMMQVRVPVSGNGLYFGALASFSF